MGLATPDGMTPLIQATGVTAVVSIVACRAA